MRSQSECLKHANDEETEKKQKPVVRAEACKFLEARELVDISMAGKKSIQSETPVKNYSKKSQF